MNHTFKVLILSILIFASVDGYAQTHSFSPGWCRLAKPGKNQVKGESAILQCKVCAKEKETEQNAKKVEDKRRSDVATANYKAKKADEKIAADLKKAENLKNENSGKVFINAPKTVPSKAGTNKKAESQKPKDHYFYSHGYGLHSLLNMKNLKNDKNWFVVNGDTIFNKNEFGKCVALMLEGNNNDPENKLNFPPNIGIVILKEPKTMTLYSNNKSFEREVPISDLIDAKGNRLINDDAITYIIHFVGDYFLLFKGSFFNNYQTSYFTFDDAEIYNYKTKKSYALRKEQSIYNKVTVASDINSTYVSYSVDKDKFKQKGDYQAFFLTEIKHKSYVVYYITNDGKIEEQEINQ